MVVKGKREYEKFLKGEPLSRKQAIKAHCYECNGLESSNVDCQGTNCPLYAYFSYKGVKDDMVVGVDSKVVN
jgi:hypothetical protein